jgi:acetyl esterase/lipase
MSGVGILHWLFILSMGSNLGPHAYTSQNVIYAEHTQEKLAADIIRPADNKNYPGVIMVHGGSWGGRSRDDMTKISELLASHGFVVMNLSYRFAPKHRYPAQIEDVAAAIQFFKNHKEKFNLDAENLAGWGYSAGAHLITQWALLEGKKHNKPQLKAIVAGGAPFDLSWYPFSPIITHLLDGFRDQRLAEYKEASPTTHVGPWAPAMFMFHAENDRLVEAVQSSHMQNLLRAHKIETELHLIKTWGHPTAFLFSQEAVMGGLQFLKQKTKNLNAANW